MHYLLACLLPPLAVVFSGGGLFSVLINVFLTSLGWFPGVIHAAYKVGQFHEAELIVWKIRHLNGVNEPVPMRWPFIIAFPLAALAATPLLVLAWVLLKSAQGS